MSPGTSVSRSRNRAGELAGGQRPVVFVSSTIRDLGDLRSATKYFLEEHGFEVHTSETSDFPHPVDREAWRAALETIDRADYFVGLLGHRYGTVVDDGLSVTHQEFLRARARKRETGSPNMILLARDEVIRFQREGFQPSDAENWEGVTSLFRDMNLAEGPGDPNWISGFSSFRDVADVLRATMRLRGPLRRRALEANLVAEIEENTRRLFVRMRRLELPAWDLLPPRELDLQRPEELVPVDERSAAGMKFLFVIADRAGALRTEALADAIGSGEFLEFDATSGRMASCPYLDLLVELRASVEGLQPLRSILRSPRLMEEFGGFSATTGQAAVEYELAFALYAYRDHLENTGALLKAAYRPLVTDEDVARQGPPRPPTPLRGETGRIAAEEVAVELARVWLLAV